jgi:hypothetical protein
MIIYMALFTVYRLAVPVPFAAAALVNEFNIIASPLVCVVCSKFRLISKLSIVPLEVVPFNTACGCGWSGGGSEVELTGMIPSAWRAGSDDTGSWTGMALVVGPCSLLTAVVGVTGG